MERYNPHAEWPATIMLLTFLHHYKVSFLEHFEPDTNESKIYFKVKKQYYENFVFEFDNTVNRANSRRQPAEDMYDLCEYIENKELCRPKWIEKHFDFLKCHESRKPPVY